MLSTKAQKRTAEEISNSSNVIGQGTFLKGDLVAPGNLRIEGTIEGNIQSQSKVVLGSSCHLQGDLNAKNADVEGEVSGNIIVEELLMLKATAVVHGDINTTRLVIEPGAIFNGGCKMASGAKAKKTEGKSREMATQAG